MDNQIYSTGLPGILPVQNGNSIKDPLPAISEGVIGGNLVKTVDGREVHRFLQVGKDYTTWMKDRIKQFGFIEGIDYLLTEIGERLPSGTKYRTEYFITIGMGKELGMVDRSKRGREIRKYFLAIEEQKTARPMTPAEMFLHNAQAMVAMERMQADHQKALTAFDVRIERIEDTAPLKVKPQNTETISEVRKRINRKYGLPERIINEVMALPYRPRTFAMVKNSHENAEGSSFAVYLIKDVSTVFRRFVSECTPATATTGTHVDIEGRFKLVTGGVK